MLDRGGAEILKSHIAFSELQDRASNWQSIHFGDPPDTTILGIVVGFYGGHRAGGLRKCEGCVTNGSRIVQVIGNWIQTEQGVRGKEVELHGRTCLRKLCHWGRDCWSPRPTVSDKLPSKPRLWASGWMVTTTEEDWCKGWTKGDCHVDIGGWFGQVVVEVDLSGS